MGDDKGLGLAFLSVTVWINQVINLIVATITLPFRFISLLFIPEFK